MILLMSSLVGILFAISVYLLLKENLMSWLFGIVILSSSTNLVIFASGRLNSIQPVFISGSHAVPGLLANPLPQALILTAIVIGFGLLAFSFVLVRQVWLNLGSLNTGELNLAEPADAIKDEEIY